MVRIIYIKNSNIPSIAPNVSCIGYFDGVHKGHQKLIEKTVAEARKQKLVPSLICFNPDPNDVINSNKNKHLLSLKRRLELIECYGIKQVIIINFNELLMNLKAKDFVTQYLNKMNIQTLICGFDFTYGYKGLGNANSLLKSKLFKTIVIEEYLYRGQKVSTTRIKNELINANFKLVNRLLGYDYYTIVKVVKCSKNGSKWLIEAKLKDNKCLLPKNGTYGKGFEIRNSKIYMLGSSELKIGQEVLISFSNYE